MDRLQFQTKRQEIKVEHIEQEGHHKQNIKEELTLNISNNGFVKEEFLAYDQQQLSKAYAFITYFDPSEAPLLTTFKLKKNEIQKIIKYRQVLLKQDQHFEQSIQDSNDIQIPQKNTKLKEIKQVEQIQQESPFIIVKNHKVSTSRIAYSWKKKREMMKFRNNNVSLPTLYAMKQKNRVYAKRAIRKAQKIYKDSNGISYEKLFNKINFKPFIIPQSIDNNVKIQQEIIEKNLQPKKNKKINQNNRKSQPKKINSNKSIKILQEKYIPTFLQNTYTFHEELQWYTNKQQFNKKCGQKILDLERRKL